MDALDRRLLNLMQTEFPLLEEPYGALAHRLGTDTGEVMQRIAQLRNRGVIRLVGPVLDSRSLGYQTTLVALRVAEEGLGRTEEVIRGHPGVSHGYERDHPFNVWFTLAVAPSASLETEVARLARSAGAEASFSLPAVKVYKIGAYFDMDGDGQTPATRGRGALARQVELSPVDRLIINELQQDLPLVPRPFTAMAERLNLGVEDFLTVCRSLLERGVIRRFSASINHTRAGFTANAMTCWAAPPDTNTIDVAGGRLASLKEVSHCYQRKTSPLWRYNLFAMMHGRSREACRELADRVSRETGLADYVLLYSVKEFKKTRVRYLV